ncbi:hypothetical protein [Streptomyces albipurpureus]|nr:hypothetical protein [Streptomyces sp. CWNU-1]
MSPVEQLRAPSPLVGLDLAQDMDRYENVRASFDGVAAAAICPTW